MFLSILLWAAPFLVIPVTYFFFRFLPFRKARYTGYGVLLAAAFFQNLFCCSFHNDLFDTILLLAVNFIAAEFFWNLLRLKKMKLFLVLLILALGFYGLQFRRWIASGPEHGWELWKDTVASTYRADSVLYTLRERKLFDVKREHPPRLLILSKRIGFSPFEREISHHETPPGFDETDFIYVWSTTSQGARLDLHVPGFDRQIWTMGEGF
jgi:hypothetical protein